ncbi:MAG: MFS transporter [Bryobacterales bacterium]|nr:MFS transporter [Bryobacterales bacterium]
MTRAQAWIAFLLAAFSVLSYVDRTLLSVAAPSIIREFGLSETQMGIVFSAFTLSYMLLMTPGGRWADRFGPRKVLTVMGLGSGLFTVLVPLGPVLAPAIGFIPAMVLLRLVFGAFTSPLYPASGRMNANWIPLDKRTFVQGIVNSGAGLGGAISPLLFTFLMAAFGWRNSFVMAGLVTIAVAMLWHFTVTDRKASLPTPPEIKPAWGTLLPNRNLQLLTLGYFAVDYFEYIFFYWLYYYLGEIRKVPPSEIAFWATMPFVAWLILMPLGGWWADRAASMWGMRRGYRIVAVTGMTLSVACLLLAMQCESVGAMVSLLSFSFGSCAAADVVFWAATIAISGKQVGAACGIMNTGGNIGGILAPMLTPMLAARYGWSAGLYFGGAIAAIALVCWFFIDSEVAAEV